MCSDTPETRKTILRFCPSDRYTVTAHASSDLANDRVGCQTANTRDSLRCTTTKQNDLFDANLCGFCCFVDIHFVTNKWQQQDQQLAPDTLFAAPAVRGGKQTATRYTRAQDLNTKMKRKTRFAAAQEAEHEEPEQPEVSEDVDMPADSDDEAPESVSFKAAKEESVAQKRTEAKARKT